jgi:hypothetical protein
MTRVVALALACGSCATGNQLRIPATRAGEPELRWPPVPVDGYITTAGTHARLPGGFMIERGDSVWFLPGSDGPRPGIITLRRPVATVTLHRDSVRTIVARLEDHQPNPAAAAVGGALLLTVLGVTLLFGGLYPFWFGS